jgi:hypothetical protein
MCNLSHAQIKTRIKEALKLARNEKSRLSPAHSTPDTYPQKCVSGFIKNHMEITP